MKSIRLNGSFKPKCQIISSRSTLARTPCIYAETARPEVQSYYSASVVTCNEYSGIISHSNRNEMVNMHASSCGVRRAAGRLLCKRECRDDCIDRESFQTSFLVGR